MKFVEGENERESSHRFHQKKKKLRITLTLKKTQLIWAFSRETDWTRDEFQIGEGLCKNDDNSMYTTDWMTIFLCLHIQDTQQFCWQWNENRSEECEMRKVFFSWFFSSFYQSSTIEVSRDLKNFQTDIEHRIYLREREAIWRGRMANYESSDKGSI